MNKECPNCCTSRSREELRVCSCNEIICNDEQCKIEHMLTSHLRMRELEDDEWEEIE